MNNLKEVKTYWDNGKVRLHYFMNINNCFVGLFSEYFENGTVFRQIFFKETNGILPIVHGINKEFWSARKDLYTFKDGVRNGIELKIV